VISVPSTPRIENPAEFRSPIAILVADDDPKNAFALQAALLPLGHEVVVAHSGGEALRRLIARDFALVILDIRMPDVNGFEVAKLVRSRERSQKVPIIFITGQDATDDRALEAYALGAIDFLVKPVPAEVVRAKSAALIDLQLRAAEIQDRAQRLRHAEELAARSAERDAAYAELARAHETLEAVDRRKDAFLAALAHELRNPLHALELGLMALRGGIDADQERSVTARMERQLKLMRRLTDDLYDISRVRSGKIELRTDLIDLRAALHDAIEMIMPAVDAKAHALDVRVTSEPLEVRGDSARLVQVFANLLSNAARYTERGGRIDVDARREEVHAIVDVCDDGPGIPPAMLEAVFEPNVQLQPNESTGGLGIGLYLARHFVSRLGGSISARSMGRGSCFTVRYPLAIEE
jgi:signal transduction histidine kinase